MAISTWSDACLYVAQHDLSGKHNKVDWSVAVQAKKADVFRAGGWEKVVGGLKSFALSGEGLVEFGAGEPDPVLFDGLGVAGVPLTVSPTGGDGDTAYFTTGVQGEYTTGDAVGELLPFKHAFSGEGKPVVRGTILHADATARTSSGNGTVRNVGAVAAGQTLYAVLHVLSASGTSPNLTVKLQSDDATGFTSPTDRITFTAATAATSQFATPVAGPVTDAFWRANWTVTGTTPSFKFVLVMGIV